VRVVFDASSIVGAALKTDGTPMWALRIARTHDTIVMSVPVLAEISDVSRAAALLSWDQNVMMPPRGAPARAEQLATLGRIVRESETIAVVEVERVSRDWGAVILKVVRDLKGKAGSDSLKHRLMRANESSVDLPILEWSEPGSRGVLFASGIGVALRFAPARAGFRLCRCPRAERGFGRFDHAVLGFDFAAGGREFALDRLQPPAFSEPPRRAGRGVRGDRKAVPAPKIAVA